MKAKIRITNPASGQPTWITLRNAKRYVARGRAHWNDDGSICFAGRLHERITEDHALALQSMIGYDRIERMTVDQLKGIPVLGDPVKLFMLRT